MKAQLELQGNSLVLVSKFKQDKAEAVAQGNWGIASASRAFVNTVREQHSHTGCIANGRGTVWAAAFGAYNDMDGADIDVKGAAVGVDTKVGSCSTVGLAVGYADGEVSPTGLRDVDQEGTYVALYGEHGHRSRRYLSHRRALERQRQLRLQHDGRLQGAPCERRRQLHVLRKVPPVN